MDMVVLFLSVQRSPTSKPPRDYLIFPFYPFFYALFLKTFLTCVLPLFSSCCRYLIMAGWADSATVWVLYNRYIGGPTPDALSVRCSLFLSLFLSVSLPALSSPSTFSFSFSLYLHSIFCAPTHPPFSNSHYYCTAFLRCMSLSVLLSTKQMHHTATAFSTIFINEVVAVACCRAGNGVGSRRSSLRSSAGMFLCKPTNRSMRRAAMIKDGIQC